MIEFLKEEEANRRLLFVDNLRHIMRTKGISANKVAKRMDVSPYTINNYTRGKIMPNDEQLKELAQALECTVDDLFDESYIPWQMGGDK